HPEREVRSEQLHIDCAGDEYSPGADSGFGRSPYFDFFDGRLRFGTSGGGDVLARFGSASAFLPQSIET
ncbi:hypothetical protein KJ969_02295, partial [Patescibacteria group bacterium]|nr:hypothetical protein [Patescibacteria group bacterium]MBU1922294.1 hypothetical protein [Patescibacteria group bacterium]